MKKIHMRNYFKKYRKSIFLISILYLVVIIAAMGIPYLLGRTISELETGNVTRAFLLRQFAFVVFTYFVWNVSTGILQYKFEATNKRFELDLRMDCITYIIEGNYASFESKDNSEILNKLTKDTEKVEQTFSNAYHLITALIRSITLIIVMFCINFTLGAIITCFFIVILTLLKTTSKSLNSLYSKYKNQDEKIFKMIRNFLDGFKTIKVFSLESNALSNIKKEAKYALDDYLKIAKKKSIIQNFNFFMSSIFKVTTIFVGGLLYLVKKITIGEIFTMYSYSIQLAGYLRRIIELNIIMKDVNSSLIRLNEFISAFELRSNQGEIAIDVVDSIRLENVSFGYTTTLFKSINIDTEKGDIISILGPNGSGKSTLTNILMGLYDVEGAYVNGIDFKSILKTYSNVALVEQNPYLLPDSIMNNITCFDTSKEEKVYKIIDDIELNEVFDKLERGLDTIVSEDGHNLSGGETQLIAILRAIVSDREIIILDEFNSALDVDYRKKLNKKLKNYFNKKIVFIISHSDEAHELSNKKIDLTNYY